MHIIVCIKSVILKAPEGDVVRSDDLCELNPYDRPVLEKAIALKEAHGGKVTALSMGPESSRFGLWEALAMGVDEGLLLCDPALAGSDTLATSVALCAAINRLNPFDLVLFGTRTADSDTGQVGPQTAARLGIPMVGRVHDIEYREKALRVERTIDGFVETFDTGLPTALTIRSGAVQPRDISLSGIEGAFVENRLTLWGLSHVGLSPEAVGELGSGTRVTSVSRTNQARTCEFLAGEAGEMADALIFRLRETGLIG
jgi:electron transfer flavoprotein beta subunit